MLINATDVRTGVRVVTGLPAISPYLLISGDPLTPDNNESIVGLDVSGQLAARDAARISSAFPWGLDSVLVAPTNDRIDDRLLIDGGLVDNTGLDTLAAVFQGLSWTTSPVLEVLRQRGVVLVEVDAGAKPPRRGELFRQAATVTEPIEGLAAAAAVRDRTLREYHVKRIEAAVNGSDGVSRFARVVLPYDPDACEGVTAEVMTAWSLGPDDIANALTLFGCAEPEWRANLWRAFDGLAEPAFVVPDRAEPAPMAF
ncbi:MAG: hypothetical protein H6738_25650 [Alphaproteobacteria bacterium]|nr:hypothetical protein [Alphaproteobacteria bacterium]MCB9700197.1 hypothetical protein [Alphaproteobacteria bacterium]